MLGGPGSGKSTVIEFLRFAFDQLSEIEEVKSDSFGKLEDLAGIGCVIEAKVVKQSGEEYIIRRTYDQFENPIEISRVSDGQLLNDVQLKTFFPVHAYSQGEALIISRNPLAQLDLIDRHLDLDQYKNNIQDACRKIESQIDGLVTLESIINDRTIYQKEISNIEANISEIRGELSKILAVQNNPVVKLHPYWMLEKTYLINIINSIATTKQEIETYFNQMDFAILNIPFPEDQTPNLEIIEKVQSSSKKLSDYKKESQKKFVEDLVEIEKIIRAEAESWKKLFEKHEQEYKAIMEVQGVQKVKDLNDELEKFNRKKANYQAALAKIEAAQKQYDIQMELRAKYLETIKDQKLRIATLRNQKAKEIVKSIGKLRIVLIPEGNRDAYKKYLAEIMTSSHARSPIIDAICAKIHPIQLAQFIRNNDAEQIDSVAGIGDWSQKLVDQFRAKPGNIYHLESIPIEDYLEISFEIESGVFRSLDKLSIGQKATVIVILSMIEGTSPIIFDQPEDALYTPFIFSNIVKLVRDSKEKRQFVFATHNPNIAVASDLDLGIVLEGTSIATSVQAAGGMDDVNTKNLVVIHLEGGEKAIKARLKEYQIKDL